MSDGGRAGQARTEFGSGEFQPSTQPAGELPVTRQAATKPLRVLERADAVTGKRESRERETVARPSEIDQPQVARQAIAQQWANALGRLQVSVEVETFRMKTSKSEFSRHGEVVESPCIAFSGSSGKI